MKQKTNLFARAATMLLLAVLSSVGAWAQSEVVSIGNTDKSDGSLPIDQYSKYSLTQQIYTKDEINHAAGKITSIAFYGYDYGMERTCDVYLSPTTKNAFESNTDWVKVAPEDKVFSGHITVNNGLWSIIDFDTPYEYDGKFQGFFGANEVVYNPIDMLHPVYRGVGCILWQEELHSTLL